MHPFYFTAFYRQYFMRKMYIRLFSLPPMCGINVFHVNFKLYLIQSFTLNFTTQFCMANDSALSFAYSANFSLQFFEIFCTSLTNQKIVAKKIDRSSKATLMHIPREKFACLTKFFHKLFSTISLCRDS